MVAVRIRPLSQKEQLKENVIIIAKPVNDTRILVYDPHEDQFEGIFRKERLREKLYQFDGVFGADSTQEEVFDYSVRFLVDSVLDGFNSSVFAYGLTVFI